ncbi:hypothetical protein J2T56_002944 [Natronobacillus azotifigens]|uniref:DUF2974 domain-containing protein n=1 Tax=Natronobacillus azotifigens TaxID=472978 RepID=A0A9J6RGA0_9BACI|nr:hypothetical protein [Natronobacillus azotifigens]MCZ0704462.1 hypothetical protein [Natronobacillus azotifigens]
MLTSVVEASQMTSDQDLVQMAGYHAYLEIPLDSHFEIYDTWYRVLDTISDTKTGLDAITVRNLTNEEIIVVYVGTDKNQTQDIITDIQLLSEMDVPQLKAAQAYFDKMNAKYGVDAITGNSLGGALVGAVAVEHPVRAVTLNPALLPEGMMDPDQTYDHVTNYFSSYDILTNTLTALEFDTRIPGKHYDIFNGTPNGLDKIGPNHTGYLRNAEGTQYHMIREEGEPGAGVIHIAADEHIVTSLWTGLPLYGERSERIKINPETLLVLATGLETSVADRLERSDTYLVSAVEIVKDVGAQITERTTKLQTTFEDFIEREAAHSFFTGITSLGTKAKNDTNYLFGLLDEAEIESTLLSNILASPPAKLFDVLVTKRLNIFHLFREMSDGLGSFRSGIDELIRAFDMIMNQTLPEMFQDALHKRDAVVEKLDDHYQMVLENSQRLSNQLDTLGDQVTKTASTFDQRDFQVAISIQQQANAIREVVNIPTIDPYHFKDSNEMRDKKALKDEQAELAYTLLFQQISRVIDPILSGLSLSARLVELKAKAIAHTTRGVKRFVFKKTVPGIIIGLFTDYDDRVRDRVSKVLEPIDELEATIRGIRQGINRLRENFPELLANFRPYIENAIFADRKYADVYAYNRAAVAILKEMQLLFDDIVYQLSDHEANSIQELTINAGRMKTNMGMLQEQVERVTFF